jgi:hypothetical protein
MKVFSNHSYSTNQSVNIQQEYFDTIFLNKISFAINFLLIIIGIIDNSICIYVFLQRKMIKIKFNWYLLVLAIFELLFCFILFIDYSFRLIYQKPMFLHDFNVFANMIIDYILHLIDSYVTLVTMILSIDRYLAIKNPTQIRKLFTYKHSKLLAWVTFLSLVILKIPGVILCYGNFNIIYCTIVSPILFNILPIISIFVINIFIFFKLSRFNLAQNPSLNSSRFSKRDSETSKRSNLSILAKNSRPFSHACTQKSYYIIMVLSSWLIITTAPHYSINIIYSLFQLKLFSNLFDFKIVSKIQAFFSVFFNLNHSLNFFFYYCFNYEFRRLMLKRIKNLKISTSQMLSSFNTSTF